MYNNHGKRQCLSARSARLDHFDHFTHSKFNLTTRVDSNGADTTRYLTSVFNIHSDNEG